MIHPDPEHRVWLQRLVQQLREEFAEIPDGALNDCVESAHMEAAIEVNDCGLPAQLEYLLRSGWSPEDIRFCVKERNGVIRVPRDEAERLQKATQKAPEGGDDLLFDREYRFPDGYRMVVQVIRSTADPTQPCWAQAVLFDTQGLERDTLVRDEFLGTYIVGDYGVLVVASDRSGS